jgi:hypothetical protein
MSKIATVIVNFMFKLFTLSEKKETTYIQKLFTVIEVLQEYIVNQLKATYWLKQIL